MSHQPPQKTKFHDLLDDFAGTFHADITIWFGADQNHKSSGTMTNSFVLNGLYLQQDFQGDSPEVDSPVPPFSGKGFWGYNTTTQVYEGFWIDNASTTMQLERGTVDASGTVWTMMSSFVSPNNGVSMDRKSVITRIDENHHTMESFISASDGTEFKNMEIRYQRAAE